MPAPMSARIAATAIALMTEILWGQLERLLEPRKQRSLSVCIWALVRSRKPTWARIPTDQNHVMRLDTAVQGWGLVQSGAASLAGKYWRLGQKLGPYPVCPFGQVDSGQVAQVSGVPRLLAKLIVAGLLRAGHNVIRLDTHGFPSAARLVRDVQ